MHFVWQTVEQIRECNSVLCPHGLPNDDLVYVIKFIPVFVVDIDISHQRLKFWSSRNGNIQCFSCEKCLQIIQVKVVFIYKICQKLVSQTIKCRHDWQCNIPFSVWRSIDHSKKKAGCYEKSRMAFQLTIAGYTILVMFVWRIWYGPINDILTDILLLQINFLLDFVLMF